MFALVGRSLGVVVLLVGLTSAGDWTPPFEPDAPTPETHSAARPMQCDGSPGGHPDDGCRSATVCRVYRVTAYCDRGLTAAGVPSGVGQCAAPQDIPFGARVYLPALDRTFIVTDRTARRFRHNTVDLFIPDRGRCLRFGCRYLECQITLPEEQVRYASRRLRDAVARVRR
jgi:3D (Asp-Asp-Asp) domain-containing protein